MRKFHLKSLLLGIGMGIVLSSFVGIIHSAGMDNELTKEEIIERAEYYGMVFHEEFIEGGD
ncbi:hypothetical protein RBH29_05355 [Herbivorax sp. ANBcel31]|uniref:hypothetical protein n=1 Tax=Herbivorax sp. ANBcel31 TaxID=3069754 RepID=UPI0027B0E291|nr:hypothetical protein [Herbivorax sp. ANBcel31]MDQ2085863.1 hypothetical protein [Herbivorax sp. ANBcel31]